MARVLIIGAGGVGGVVAHKCAMNADVFTHITLASRTKAKCDRLAREIRDLHGVSIKTAAVDADDVTATAALIRKTRAELVINVALPYQDLHIMDACLKAGCHYLDTANYEPRDVAKFEYKWQWAYRAKFEKAKLMAVLGSGFDPGVSNVFCAYAAKHHFDTIESIDIMDCNGGSHGKAFATNFNPEINIREITQRGKFFENGKWKETDPLSVHHPFDFAEVGEREMYLMYHEELESLAQNIQGLTLDELLPEGWTLGEVADSSGKAVVDKAEGNRLRISWPAAVAFPIEVRYTILAPSVSGRFALVGEILVNLASAVQNVSVPPAVIAEALEAARCHTVDTNRDWRISLSEVLRAVQLFNSGSYGLGGSTEDGYLPGGADRNGAPHRGDLNGNWQFELSELLRIVQLYNTDGGWYYVGDGTEDGFLAGLL